MDQSAYFLADHVNVRDGQSVASGGYGYGIEFNESTHNSSVVNSAFENVRENTFTNGVKFSSFSHNNVVGSYDTGFNLHGSGCLHILIDGNTMVSPGGYGISVGQSVTQNAADREIIISNNNVTSSGSHGIAISGTSGKETLFVTVIGNKIYDYGLAGATSGGIYITYANNVTISGNLVDAAARTWATRCLQIGTVNDVVISSNIFQNSTTGYGVVYEDVNNVLILGNNFRNNLSYNLYAVGTNSKVYADGNMMDTVNASMDANTKLGQNLWATKYDRNSGSDNTADGGTITHNMRGTPTRVTCTTSVASEFCSVTTIGATTFTVAIKKHDNSAGTTQPIYWSSEM